MTIFLKEFTKPVGQYQSKYLVFRFEEDKRKGGLIFYIIPSASSERFFFRKETPLNYFNNEEVLLIAEIMKQLPSIKKEIENSRAFYKNVLINPESVTKDDIYKIAELRGNIEEYNDGRLQAYIDYETQFLLIKKNSNYVFYFRSPHFSVDKGYGLSTLKRIMDKYYK